MDIYFRYTLYPEVNTRMMEDETRERRIAGRGKMEDETGERRIARRGKMEDETGERRIAGRGTWRTWVDGGRDWEKAYSKTNDQIG